MTVDALIDRVEYDVSMNIQEQLISKVRDDLVEDDHLYSLIVT